MSYRLHISIVVISLAFAGCASVPPPIAQTTPTQTATTPVLPSLPPEITPRQEAEVPQKTGESVAPEVEEPRVAIVTEPDLWMRIRNHFGLGELDSPLVKEHETWYARRPEYVARMTTRSQLYLFHIVEEVDRRGLPSEIALLPMIESAFNPTAFSRSSAAGIWQFVPSTGKNFGLDQNWWYDGRRNVLAATNAALDYLEKLYKMFGSWDLALAAYNCGEGTVSRAIAKNRAQGLPTDYLNLRLPQETRNYLPKLLAIKHIIANPQSYGITLSELPDKPFFTSVTIKKHIDVALAARFADMKLEEFTALNPAYNKPVITHNDNEVLLLPSSKVEIFNANMKRYGDRQLHSWQAYQGNRGERLDKIAAKFDMTPSRLRAVNHVQEKRGKLKLAQLLLVPMKLAKPLPTDAQIAATKVPAPQPTVSKDTRQVLLAQAGNSSGVAAPRLDTTLESMENHPESGVRKTTGEVMQSKNLAVTSTVATAPMVNSSDPIHSLLAAKNTRTSKPAAPAKRAFYTVKRGDSLYSIAQVFQVAVKDLQRWNNMRNKSRLMPGIKIKVVSP